MEQNKLLLPEELKTIEVDVEKKIFRVNGKDFGKGTTAFSISCKAGESYRITMETDTETRIAEYRTWNGKKITGRVWGRSKE